MAVAAIAVALSIWAVAAAAAAVVVAWRRLVVARCYCRNSSLLQPYALRQVCLNMKTRGRQQTYTGASAGSPTLWTRPPTRKTAEG